MAEAKDFIDITPPGVSSDGKGTKGKTSTVFQESEQINIQHNPSRLTKEGIDEKVRIWKNSHNAHIRIMYETMKIRCRNVADSGTLEDGRIIFSRNKDGSPNWLGELKIVPKEVKTKTK